MFGGGMRQVRPAAGRARGAIPRQALACTTAVLRGYEPQAGVIAAAGLYALKHNLPRCAPRAARGAARRGAARGRARVRAGPACEGVRRSKRMHVQVSLREGFKDTCP
jgi:hypothetical protein